MLGASLRSSLPFNPRPRRLSTPTNAYELHPDIASYGTTLRRAAKNAGDAPGAARIVYVGSKLEKTGDVAKRLVWACDENGAMTRDPREIFQSRGGERGEAAADGAVDEGSDPFAFDTFKTYGTAKQAATALTLTLARKTRAAHGDSIVVHACTPGMVRTNLSRFMHPLAFYASQPVQWALIKSPRQGASAPVYCATSTDAVAREHTAGYFGTESSFADGMDGHDCLIEVEE